MPKLLTKRIGIFLIGDPGKSAAFFRVVETKTQGDRGDLRHISLVIPFNERSDGALAVGLGHEAAGAVLRADPFRFIWRKGFVHTVEFVPFVGVFRHVEGAENEVAHGVEDGLSAVDLHTLHLMRAAASRRFRS